MWTRKELKKNALSRFRANYWLCVLAALILAALLGNFKAENRYSEEDIGNPKSYPQMVIEENGLNTNAVTEAEAVREQFDEIAESAAEEFGSKEIAVGVMLGAIAVVLTIIIVFVIALDTFVLNILEFGGRGFFLANHDSKASIKEFGQGFSEGYKRVCLTMFLRDLYIILWSCLFAIPGIVKAYEYKMIPYILKEHPELDHKEVFALSKKMMSGNKWKAFVLDLSFIGWGILDLLTFGVLGVFFLNPYVFQTDAELYVKIRDLGVASKENEEPVVYDNYIEV